MRLKNCRVLESIWRFVVYGYGALWFALWLHGLWSYGFELTHNLRAFANISKVDKRFMSIKVEFKYKLTRQSTCRIDCLSFNIYI